MSSHWKKVVAVAAIFLVILAVLAVLVAPKLVGVNRYRSRVAAYLESKTGKPVRIGHLELTLFPHLAIQVDNFVMENPRDFPAGDFVRAQRIYAVLEARPLLHKKIVVQSLIIEKPLIHLISNADGHWNFENPAKRRSDPADPPGPGRPGFSLEEISKVTMDQGQVTMANLLPAGRMGPTFFNAQGISCSFQDVNVSALAALNSPAASSRPAKPSITKSPQPPGIQPAKSNSSAAVAHGTFHANSLLFGAVLATSIVSRVLLFPRQAYLDGLTLKVAGGSARGDLAFDLSQLNLLYSIQTTFQNISVAQLLRAFPSATGKMTGTMDGKFDLNGEAVHSSAPLGQLQGTGKVSIRNGKLPTLQLNRNLMLLVRMAGIGAPSGDPASFSSISADLHFAHRKLASRNIRIVSNDLDVDASGKIGLTGSNALNYTGTGHILARQSGLTNLLSRLSAITFSNGKLSFSFALHGTLEKPKFMLKPASRALGSAPSAAHSGGKRGNQPGKTVQDLMNLFRKKKPSSTPPKQ